MDEINDKLRAAEGEFDTLVGMRIGSFNIGLLLTRPVRTEDDQRAIEANNIAMMDNNGNIPPAEFRVPRHEYLSSQHILLEIPEAIFDRINRDAHYVMPVVTTREGLNNLGVPYERMKVGMITQQTSPDGAMTGVVLPLSLRKKITVTWLKPCCLK